MAAREESDGLVEGVDWIEEPVDPGSGPAATWAGTLLGVRGHPVRVEVEASGIGMPMFQVVGLPDGAVREGGARIRSAIRNAKLGWPEGHITVNLAPASLRKDGTALDLPIAIAILAARGLLPREELARGPMLLGELGLDGSLRPVRGVLCLAAAARRARIPEIVVPEGNAREAAVVEGVRVRPARCLEDVVEHLRGRHELPMQRGEPLGPATRRDGSTPDLLRVRGQATAKRALEIAAAGAHNLLLVGPPGAGKTLLARCMPGILPPMSFAESIEASQVHSVAGRLLDGSGLLAERPFRAPHHTISDAGLIGGGASPRPGEVSLAHNGVLFLDELPEFRRGVLEVLRQPLESGRVTIGRATMTLSYPARFMLVAAMNPCPCGYRGHPGKPCTCEERDVRRYQGRVSGPLLDRIDLTVQVAGLRFEELRGEPDGPTSEELRIRVVEARAHQRKRLGEAGTNAAMDERALERHGRVGGEAERLLGACMERLHLSARAHARLLKVSRTIADLDGRAAIEARDIAEAVQFRCGIDR